MQYFHYIIPENSHQQGGNQLTQPTRPPKRMAWLLFGDRVTWRAFCCTFKDSCITLGANIGYNSIWKLSAQMTIGSTNDDRERK